MSNPNSDTDERVRQIRERWSVKVSNTKSWGERPTLQSVGGMEGAMADIDYLLSLHDSRATCGQLQDDDELVAEMNTVAANLVRDWYCDSQHRDELVEEIVVTLTAAHRRSEANAATRMRDRCVQEIKDRLYSPTLKYANKGIEAAIIDWTHRLIIVLESLEK